MRIHIAALFLLCVLPVIRAADGPLCFSCERVDRLESCKTVTHCEEDEQCMVSKYRTNTGGEIVNFQCQKKATCELLSSFHPFGRREEEIQVCVECCEGDLCQSSTKNCPGGTPSHPQKSKLCYVCDEIAHTATCDHVEFCPDEEELCFIHHSISQTGDRIKSMGCKKPSTCKVWTNMLHQHTHNSGFVCHDCCNQPACNSECQSVYVSTTSTLTTPPTTPLPTSPPTPPPTVSTAFLTEAMLSATVSETLSPQTTPPSTPPPSRPTVVVQPRSAEAVQGRNQDVVFSCSFTGVPTPQVFWFYKGPAGKPDALHGGYTTLGASSNLTIKDPKVSDSGTYICTAINNQGHEEASATLTVHSLNSPHLTLSRDEVVDGSPDPLHIYCDSNGSTNVTYSWWFSPRNRTWQELNSTSDTLTFDPPTTSIDGHIKCEITNAAGQTSTFINVNVDVLDAPEIHVQPNETIREGEVSTVSLNCQTRGNHPDWMTWSSGSTTLEVRHDSGIVYAIHNPRFIDTADYTCTVSKDNVTKTASVHLAVYALEPPQVTASGNILPITLTCNASGTTSPDITWYEVTGGMTKEVTNGVRLLQPDLSTLNVSTPEPHQQPQYECHVTNPVGTETTVFNVTILEKPYFTTLWDGSLTVHQGQNVTLDCEGRGVPTPAVQWGFQDKDGFPETPGSHADNVLESENHFRLFIVHAVEKNHGVYFCKLMNEAGNVSRSVNITVIP